MVYSVLRRCTAILYLFSVLIMQKFLKYFVLWLSVFICITGIISCVNRYYLQSLLEVKSEALFHILLSGDSHIQTALNEEKIPGSLNIAQSSEELVFTYYKLKHFINLHPETDTLLFGLSLHTCLSYDKKPIAFADESMRRYGLLLEDYCKISEWNTYKTFWLHLLYWKIGLPNKFIWDYSKRAFKNETRFEELPFRGGSVKHASANLDTADVQVILDRHFQTETSGGTEISRMQLFYLIRLVQLCQAHAIVPVFINTPLSNEYKENTPKKYFLWHARILSLLSQKYNCFTLDYANINFERELYYDHDHLNESGMNVFSEKLRMDINDL